MYLIRLSKILMVAAMAFYVSLVSLGNITDYGSNFEFVHHVLMIDTIFPESTIRYRAITSPYIHHAAYITIICVETLTAILCWIGALELWRARRESADLFNKAKSPAIAGLVTGFLLWQTGFMTIGGEWFGMWMSEKWNGIESAFRVFITFLIVLTYLSIRDDDLPRSGSS